jgi:hypothetical protein
MPKAEAIETIAKHMAAVRTQLATSQAQLRAAEQQDKYSLNFQVNALKKRARFCKTQIARLKKIPASEVFLPDRFEA